MLVSVKVPSGTLLLPIPKSLSKAFAYLSLLALSPLQRFRYFLPSDVAVECAKWLRYILPNIALDQDLGSVASINTCICILEVRVVDMTSSKPKGRHAAPNVGVVHVMLSDMEMSLIFGSVVV